jgi:alkanesulfonate monooxygenase SsuD/methylene tetrahydromethanopterin reductase-like flavin-dependent oxidoreductase (luciferase family)
MSRRLITAVEIDGAGGHPAAWRGAEVDPSAILTGELAVRAVQRAEEAGIDLATFADALEAPADVPERVSVRLDAVGLAARVAPVTDRIGLIPTLSVTHTEPFHLQASVATLDHISSGRAGWLVDVSSSDEAAAVIGRREPAPAAETWREARYVVDVSQRLWDSWEDDAIIRDAASGRFVDRDRIHYVDFESPSFTIKGPSIVPRPPQGHPLTVVRVASEEALQAVGEADLVLLPGTTDLASRLAAVRATSPKPRVLISVTVHLGKPENVRRPLDGAGSAAGAGGGGDAGGTRGGAVVGRVEGAGGGRGAELARAAGNGAGVEHIGGVEGLAEFDYVGGVEGLAELVGEWAAAGVDGVHLRPGSLEVDVPVIADELLPLLRERGLVGPAVKRAATLRTRLGLRRPENRYAIGGRP